MVEQTNERFAITGRMLAAFEEIFDELRSNGGGWPAEISGGATLSVDWDGAIWLRGALGGVARWDLQDGWKVLLECAECGSEWWKGDAPPLSRCCRATDIAATGEAAR